MPARQLVALPAGVWTNVSASIFARLVKVIEDGSVAGAGLQARFRSDNFTQAYDYPPAEQPIVLGDQVAVNEGHGAIIGWPAQQNFNARPADVYLQLQPMGAAATTVRVEEYE